MPSVKWGVGSCFHDDYDVSIKVENSLLFEGLFRLI